MIDEAKLDSEEARLRTLYLGVTQEECAELIQIISKINRFGIESYNPQNPAINNRVLLTNEIGDVLGMIELLLQTPSLGLVREELEAAKLKKIEKMKYWANYAVT